MYTWFSVWEYWFGSNPVYPSFSLQSYVRVWAEPSQLCSEIIQADMFEDYTGSNNNS